MKRLLTFALGLAALASCNGVKWTLTETEYGYNVMTQKKGQTIAYSPESGISILTVDGYAFKDLNRNTGTIDAVFFNDEQNIIRQIRVTKCTAGVAKGRYSNLLVCKIYGELGSYFCIFYIFPIFL